MDLSKYVNPALQFSGGKDSLACLYLLRDRLDEITVYWLNTGDTCPETKAVVDEVRPWVPKFVEITTDVKGWRRAHGNPSDIVPAACTPIGRLYDTTPAPMPGRFDCCVANIMAPMHRAMIEDGVDAVIRGTKLADTGRVPVAGPTDCYDVILPLMDWSHEQVFSYLTSVGAPRNPIYDHFRSISAPECMGCTAWWEDGKADYFSAKHPEQLQGYRIALTDVRAALQSSLAALDSELEKAGGLAQIGTNLNPGDV